MAINQRIKFLVDELCDGNVSRFAKEIGVSHTSINTLMPGERESKPGFETIAKISTRFPQINTDWLIKEEGKPFKTESGMVERTHTSMQVYNNGKDKTVDNQQIPLYNLMAAAGLVTLFNSNQYILDYISIPNLPKCDGAVYVAGDSMYPLLKSGDIVIFRKVTNFDSGIRYGEMHVVEFMPDEDYITTVKYVQRSELGNEYIKLVSENRYHVPEDVHLSKVRAIAVVKASVRINAMA